MPLKTLAAASCLSMAMATSATAAPITLDFAIAGAAGATGTFYGLDDADGSYSATSYDISFLGISWTNVDASNAATNEFVFVGGALIAPIFSDSPGVIADTGTEQLLTFESYNDPSGTCCHMSVTSTRAFPDGFSTFEISPVSAIPLPAGGLLLLSGLGGVAALKRRKKHTA